MTNNQAFLEIITASFAAGELKPYAMSGGYFELIDCPYPVTVRLIGLNGELKAIMRNAEASFYIRDGSFQNIEIESPRAQTIRFAFGTSEAGTRRTSGVVQVVDGGLARTLAGEAHGWAGGAPAVAAQYSFAQLFNPVASTKNVLVKAFAVSVPGSTAISVYVNKTALGAPTAFQPVATKNQDGTAPVVQTREGSLGAITVGPKYIKYPTFAAAGTNTVTLQEPVLLVPGAGLVFENTTVNQQINFDAEWVEQLI